MSGERSTSSDGSPGPLTAAEIRVRPAYPRDLTPLIEFNLAMARETEEKELDRNVLEAGLRAVLEDPSKGSYFVAETGGRTVAALMVTREWSDWRNGVFWWIQSVYVVPEFRGRGVFRLLYADVLGHARASREVRGLRLYVEKENERAKRTYLAVGMHQSSYQLFEVDFTSGESAAS